MSELDIYKSRCESLSFESGLLQCANKQLQEKLDTAKEKNKRLRDKIQAARQWQTCPACSRIFATQS